ncbi:MULTISPECIES: hypothetical protein [unclassified Aureispira]|uniref:hypothetical protein n=1 Tax=unclassified Aureispira TaxID=2649989 RepID=UPI000698F1A0|nr:MULTISPECIES: hypothetical protein [unclassified Aureispira]WMX17080.1 hypothetical protein QP953_11920 [Aureispira sp. CCB-E]
MAVGQFFDSIQTGDILSGGFGNHGVSGSELAHIFGAMAQSDTIQAAQEREDRAKRTKLLVISGAVITSLSFILLLYYLTSKRPRT